MQLAREAAELEAAQPGGGARRGRALLADGPARRRGGRARRAHGPGGRARTQRAAAGGRRARRSDRHRRRAGGGRRRAAGRPVGQHPLAGGSGPSRPRAASSTSARSSIRCAAWSTCACASPTRTRRCARTPSSRSPSRPTAAPRVVVPAEAVVTDDQQLVRLRAARTTSPARLERRAVVPGRQRGGEVEILAGLQPGETYVAKGAILLLNAIDLARE